jgi:hypothetical protein
MGEKCRSTPQVTIHQHPQICHLGMQFVHNWLKKGHTPFVKVVEDQEIYNFAIHCLDHFYSTFWSFCQSNMATWKHFWHPAL